MLKYLGKNMFKDYTSLKTVTLTNLNNDDYL